ncbi:MAG TPA: hypothetical protein VIG99_32330, partial [Myxococcaceae bacterium]
RALEIAWIIAVAGNNTSAGVVAAKLGVRPLDLREAYRELEDEGVLVDDWFSHDVLREVLLEDIPEHLRRSLDPGSGDA